MNPAVYSNVASAGLDHSTAQLLPPCCQHLQSTRQFSCSRPRSCARHSRLSRRQQNAQICAVAAVEAPPQQAASPVAKQNVNGKSKKASKKSAVQFEEDGTLSNPNALYQHFEKLLQKRQYGYKQGDKVLGTVFQVDERNAYVDIGAKASALCSVDECTVARVQRATQVLKADDVREFIVVRDDVRGAGIQLSLKRLEQELTWRRMQQLQEENITIMGHVSGINKGGLMVDVDEIRGFLPMSHAPAIDNMEDYVNQDLAVKVIEVEIERQRVVFSARKANDRQIEEFNVGDIAEGTIQSIKPYGAFIDLGRGMSGLLHVSQISYDRITNVGAILSEGDKLKVMILSQDKDRGRMSLSTKKLEVAPGDMLRDPQKVFDRAEETAALFRERLAQAEAAARAQTM